MDGYPYGNLFPKPYADLLALVVPQAQAQLPEGTQQQDDNFLPFAAVGATGGAVEMVVPDAAPDDPDTLAWTLLQCIGKRVDAGEVVSAARCSFMSEQDMVWADGAGVSVLLEAQGFPPVQVMLPYRRVGKTWVLEQRPILLPGAEALFAGGSRER